MNVDCNGRPMPARSASDLGAWLRLVGLVVWVIFVLWNGWLSL